MYRFSLRTVAVTTLFAAALGTYAFPQTAAKSRPIPYPVVASSEYQHAIQMGTRTETGEPGPNYWQQWVDYDLRVALDPADKRIAGSARIAYHNNSPDTLAYVAMHLLQNLHALGAARGDAAEVTGGVELMRVAAGGRELSERGGSNRVGYTVDGTILRVYPHEPLPPGGTLELSAEWAFKVPQRGAGARMGWNSDDLFHIAYWYPQAAVYDDVVGWQTDPFLDKAEFYSPFGNYDIEIEAPAGWLVMSTGSLENAAEVLSEPVLERYRQAQESDDVVHVVTQEDFASGATTRSNNGHLIWRFRADSVRDVAFSALRRSNWDAARTPVGDRDGDGSTDYALINSFWRPSAPKWQHACRYAQHSIDFLSRWTGVPYPWPHMTAVEGGGIIGGGMEFPMMTLIGDYNTRSDSALYNVTVHELGHMWMPMIVNTDETRRGWMDEGTTTFNENQGRKEYFPGVNHEIPDRESYLFASRQGRDAAMMRWTWLHRPGVSGVISYQKPATVLAALRGLIGEDTFERAFRKFFSDWAFKHPKPWDFFNTFSTVSNRDLSWFWRAWYYEDWTLDQAVSDVEQEHSLATIVVEDRGLVPMPVRLTVTLDNGTVLEREIAAEAWLHGETRVELSIPAQSPVTRVVIDEAEEFPDIDRSNNVWVREG